MEIITLSGIVLREYPVGESDKFVHIFTKERGVIEFSVKGGRKITSRNSGGTQLFAYSKFSVRSDKGRYYLDSCEPIRLFYNIREDLDRLALADYISEVLMFAASQIEQRDDLMRLVLNTLHFLSGGERKCIFLKSIFEMRFMTEIGMMPDIVCCPVCMSYTAEQMCFDINTTKLYCDKCRHHNYDDTHIMINSAVVKALRHIVFADFDRLFNFRLSENSMKKLSEVTEKYLLYHLGREFKTLDFYKSLGN